MKKLMVTDIDGTITTKTKSLEKEIVQGIHSLYDEGWELFFITGRFFSYAKEILSEIQVPYFLGSQNGASVWSSRDDRFVFTKLVEARHLEILEQVANQYPAIFTVESGADKEDHYFRMKTSTDLDGLVKVLEKTYFPNNAANKILEVNSIKQEYPYQDFAAAKFLGKKEEIEALFQFLQQHPWIQENLMVTKIRWPYDHDYALIHLTNKSVSKGQTLKAVIRELYDHKPFIMASGDDANDLDLIAEGDFKIVMNTAPTFMHGKADFLAPPASQLGILSAWQEGEARYKKLINYSL